MDKATQDMLSNFATDPTAPKADTFFNRVNTSVATEAPKQSNPLKSAVGDSLSALTGGMMGGMMGGKPHAKVNDTPSGGLHASHGFNLFEFAPGDIVHASPAGGGGQSAGSRGGNAAPSLVFNQTFMVGEGSDRSLISGAAKQGVKAGVDEFMQAWEAGPLEPKNNPRISGRMY